MPYGTDASREITAPQFESRWLELLVLPSPLTVGGCCDNTTCELLDRPRLRTQVEARGAGG